MSHYPVCLSLIRSSRRRGRRRPRLPMRGGSNWLSSVSRLRRPLRRSWDLSWRFLPRSSTEAVCFCASPVLWNIWPLNLSSLVKLCDSVILVVKRVIHHLLRLLFQTFSSRMNRFVCQVWLVHALVVLHLPVHLATCPLHVPLVCLCFANVVWLFIRIFSVVPTIPFFKSNLDLVLARLDVLQAETTEPTTALGASQITNTFAFLFHHT